VGGNLFQLGRLPRDQYLVLETELRTWLDARFGDLYRIPRFYNQKPDFGDVDILLSEAAVDTTWPDLRDHIAAELGIETSQAQGQVFSTVYRGFQVDFSLRSEATFQSTYQFLCFNDLGNLLGKMFHRMGFTYGEQGLVYVSRRAHSHHRADLLVSQDMDRILSFLGLDPADWHRGFDTLPQMYGWVVGSPYFSSDPYLAPRTRKRDSSRTTLTQFIAYLRDRQLEKRFDHGDKADWIPRVAAAFPEARLEEAIAREQALEARDAAFRAKFNGRLVMSLCPELEGKALGAFMQAFQRRFDPLEDTILAMAPDEIAAQIVALRDAGDFLEG
jgi:hypothetical protein